MKNNIFYTIVIIILIIYFIFGNNGLLKYNNLLELKESYERQIAELEEKINDLEKRIDLLKRDKEYLEETIKKELNMAKPNEDLYIILDDNETNSNGTN